MLYTFFWVIPGRQTPGELRRREHTITFFPLKSCLLWGAVEKYARTRPAADGSTTRCMRIACWMTKAIETHSEYETLVPFSRQQWLRELAWMIRCTYVACLVLNCIYFCFVRLTFHLLCGCRIQSVNDLLSLTPAQPSAVPILTRLETFIVTKKTDCICITSATLRQRTVRKSLSMWRWLLAELLGTWQPDASLIVLRKPQKKSAGWTAFTLPIVIITRSVHRPKTSAVWSSELRSTSRSRRGKTRKQ